MQQQTRFLVYTEDINREEIVRLTEKILGGATIHAGSVGVWNGQAESSLIIECIGNSEGAVRDLAKQIKVANSQQAVLITKEPVRSELI
jgi:hypothetical protein